MIDYSSTEHPLDRDAAIDRYYESFTPVEITGWLEMLGADRTVYLVEDGLKRTEAPGVPYRVSVSLDALGHERVTCDCFWGDCAHIGCVLIERAARSALKEIADARSARSARSAHPTW